MTTPAHVISAAYIALMVAGVDNTQTSLITMSIISASVVDLDHIYYMIKDPNLVRQGKLYKARSMFHELIGFVVIGIVMLIVGQYNTQMAMVIGLSAMIHLAEDMITGISMPFSPFDKTQVHLLPQSLKLKALIDVLVIVIFGGLWIKFLNGQV